jgi:hypothetical protein
MGKLNEPEYFLYRLLIFGRDGTLRVRAFADRVERDRAAREMDDETLALAVLVEYTVNGGDYPSGIDEHPERHVKKSEPRRATGSTGRPVVHSYRR